MGGQSAPKAYQPSNQAGADQSYQTFINDLSQIQQGAANTTNQLQTQAAQVQQNPYFQTAINGANSVAQQAQGVGQGQIGAGNDLYALARSTGPLMTQVNQTAFDPQNALYNQTYQQNADQTNSINAQNGVAGSPFGAGLAGQSGQNFNLNWQNQQLGRQAAGADVNATLGGLATAANTAGGQLASQGLNTQAQGSALPSSTFMQQQAANIAALQSLSGGQMTQAGIAGMGANASGNYLNIGQGATALDQQAAAQNNAASSAMWSGLLKAGGLAASIFGGPIGAAIGGGSMLKSIAN